MLSVNFLGNFYINRESTFKIEDGKKKEVSVVLLCELNLS